MAIPNWSDERIDAYATEAQRSFLKAYRTHGLNMMQTCRALGIPRGTGRGHLRNLTRRLERQGYTPRHDLTEPGPPGQLLHGVSRQEKTADGLIQWVKYYRDKDELLQIAQDMLLGMKDEIPKAEPVPKVHQTFEGDLLCQYTITDYHLGMLAWGEETGADWDLEIAEDLIVRWFSQAIDASPRASHAVFAQLGDFLHFDGFTPVTNAHGHVLDASGRYQQIVRVAIRVIRRIINMLLCKHEHVHVVLAQGNHDERTAMVLSEWVASLYEREPRVSVDTSPGEYYAYEWGEQALFYHHGHKRKPQTVDRALAAKFKEMFGRCKYVEAHMGHMHHDMLLETELMRVYQHRTLAAPDAHTASGGWSAGRDAKVITYHRRYGRVGESVINSDMLRRD